MAQPSRFGNCLPLLCLLWLATACNFNQNSTPKQESPKAAVTAANAAIISGDVQKLTRLLHVDRETTPEMASALAALLVKIKSGAYTAFMEAHEPLWKRLQLEFPTKSNGILFSLFSLPSFADFATSGTYMKEEHVMRFSYPEQDNGLSVAPFELEFKESEEGWRFWPVGIPKDRSLLYTAQIIKGLPGITKILDTTEQKKALRQLYIDTVKPTSLEYANNTAEGRLEGRDWRLVDGVAYTGTFVEDYSYLIQLTDMAFDTEDTCEITGTEAAFFQLQIKKPGAFDLAFSDCILTIRPKQKAGTAEVSLNTITEGKVLIEMDREKQIMYGKIVAVSGDDLRINGNFEVPLCPGYN
ncbi:hypothetical protein [Maribacter sp. 2-571]|uniref:hypothetical protein n=1 Tax=Maribacter sp. 2-571 TaxID=3417569 RepID=UPI003D347D77